MQSLGPDVRWDVTGFFGRVASLLQTPTQNPVLPVVADHRLNRETVLLSRQRFEFLFGYFRHAQLRNRFAAFNSLWEGIGFDNREVTCVVNISYRCSRTRTTM